MLSIGKITLNENGFSVTMEVWEIILIGMARISNLKIQFAWKMGIKLKWKSPIENKN